MANMRYVPKATSQDVPNKKTPVILPLPFAEPLPWEMAGDRPTLPAPGTRADHHQQALQPAVANHTQPKDAFAMSLLRDTLPDPMWLEATLPPPTAYSTPSVQHTMATLPITSMSWLDPTMTNQGGAGDTVGPDGEPWLQMDPFHSYDGPTVFGPDTTWTTEEPPVHTWPTADAASANTSTLPLLDPDAETTQLPPGLLDSPPHPTWQPATTEQAEQTATDIQRLCNDMLTPPQVVVLPTPQPHQQTAEDTTVGSIMRRSKRITAQPASSSRPADRARENKLKKLGLPLDDAEHMASKKKQLLLAYKGPQKDLAEAALAGLLGQKSRTD
jgi:hypothetical protein